ncbi:MAG: DNA mismatch repair endonuclease MutL [SAR202 cluster bacterium]|nr:DNA mismatch repair endonuclease MutL [SAR202 cluster bacterium]
MGIKILPTEIATRIAAGEVIERPSSVVKELVENSIDAGATQISIQVEHGGLSSIRVTDDGEGILPEELNLAFHRHATSKISGFDDLSAIHTFGFRGEALASIAAVSDVTLTSRTGFSDSAFTVNVNNGYVSDPIETGASQGTTIFVSTLFSSVPARLKFMKSYQAEASRILSTVEHLSMANPHIKFSYDVDGKRKMTTPGNTNLRETFSALKGVNLANSMIEINFDSDRYRVIGLTSPPDKYKGNRTGISIFINGRWVTNRSITAAIEEGYRGLLMQGNYPVTVIFLEVPPDEIDVNVHPNKKEIRLVYENDGFSSVHRAIRESIFQQFPIFETPFLVHTPTMPLEAELSKQLELYEETQSSLNDGSLVYTDILTSSNDITQQYPRFEMIGQIANTYLVADGGDSMYLIDQHSAHESLLFYELMTHWEKNAPNVQPMLQPLLIEMTPEQMEAIASHTPSFERYGLSIEVFDSQSLLVTSVPLMGRHIDIKKFIDESIQSLLRKTDTTDTHVKIAASIACHSAIRGGQRLSMNEIRGLGDALISNGNPNHCPHGRPTLLRVPLQLFERQFGRI